VHVKLSQHWLQSINYTVYPNKTCYIIVWLPNMSTQLLFLQLAEERLEKLIINF